MRYKQVSLPLVLILVLACVGPAKAQNKQQAQCASARSGADDASTMLRCFPFGPAERIAGVWFDGFETNDFVDKAIRAPLVWHVRQPWTLLQFHKNQGQRYFDRNGGALRVFRVVFIGRRSVGKLLQYKQVVVVEKLLSITRIKEPQQTM